jgi:hypothetical protein
MLPQEGYFMNEVFQANDTKLPQVLFNHSAVCQRAGLTLNLCASMFQDVLGQIRFGNPQVT